MLAVSQPQKLIIIQVNEWNAQSVSWSFGMKRFTIEDMQKIPKKLVGGHGRPGDRKKNYNLKLPEFIGYIVVYHYMHAKVIKHMAMK